MKHSQSVIHYQFQCNAWCTKRWVWMSLESKIPSLLFTTSFNVMPGLLSNGSGCRMSQKFLVCYHGPNIDHYFISMENCSLETCAWTGRKTPVQLNKVTIVEDLFSLVRSETKVSCVILFLRIVFSFIQRESNLKMYC